MPGYDDPNRPEWTGKRKAKNFARINAACKGLKTSGGKPPTECPKCGTSHKFVPDGYVSFIPEGALGKTAYGTTPEEADLAGSGKADVAIVNTGVAITVETTVHPVNVNTYASEIVLPSFERMDEVAVMKVTA